MSRSLPENRATFCATIDGTKEDWDWIVAGKKEFSRELPKRALAHLKLHKGRHWGFPIDRYDHCLQSATLAYKAGMGEEYVVCALFHDVGYTLGPYTHAEIASGILRPYISRRNLWMIANHQIFEGYYFFHYFGSDRNLREKFRGNPCYTQTAHHCEAFDQCAFDPSFANMPLDVFLFQ